MNKVILLIPQDYFTLYPRITRLIRGKQLKRVCAAQLEVHIKKNTLPVGIKFCYAPIQSGVEIFAFYADVDITGDVVAPLYSLTRAYWDYQRSGKKPEDLPTEPYVLYYLDIEREKLGYLPRGRSIPENFAIVRVFHAIAPTGKTVYYEIFYEPYSVERIVSLVEREAQTAAIKVEELNYLECRKILLKYGHSGLFVKKRQLWLRISIVILLVFALLAQTILNGVYVHKNYRAKNEIAKLSVEKSDLQVAVSNKQEELKFYKSLPSSIVEDPKWNASSVLRLIGKKLYMENKTWIERYSICRGCRGVSGIESITVGAISTDLGELKTIFDSIGKELPKDKYTVEYAYEQKGKYNLLYLAFQAKQVSKAGGDDGKDKGTPRKSGSEVSYLLSDPSDVGRSSGRRYMVPVRPTPEKTWDNSAVEGSDSKTSGRGNESYESDKPLRFSEIFRVFFGTGVAYAATVSGQSLPGKGDGRGNQAVADQIQKQSNSVRGQTQSGSDAIAPQRNPDEVTKLLEYLRSHREQGEQSQRQDSRGKQEGLEGTDIQERVEKEEEELGIAQYRDNDCPDFTKLPKIELESELEKMEVNVVLPSYPPFPPDVKLKVVTDNYAVIMYGQKVVRLYKGQRNSDGIEFIRPTGDGALFGYYDGEHEVKWGSLKAWDASKRISTK
ncbi:MAG: hypothetical protein QXO76_00100 [Thermoproteota archaeon]